MKNKGRQAAARANETEAEREKAQNRESDDYSIDSKCRSLNFVLCAEKRISIGIQRTYTPTYLPTYLHTYQGTYIHTNQPRYLHTINIRCELEICLFRTETHRHI